MYPFTWEVLLSFRSFVVHMLLESSVDEYIEELEEFLDEAVGLVSLLADNEVTHLDIRV